MLAAGSSTHGSCHVQLQRAYPRPLVSCSRPASALPKVRAGTLQHFQSAADLSSCAPQVAAALHKQTFNTPLTNSTAALRLVARLCKASWYSGWEPSMQL